MVSMKSTPTNISLTDFSAITGDFGFADNKTGYVHKDGSVFYDHEGLTQYLFPTILDAYEFLINGNTSKARVSDYLGSRDEDSLLEAQLINQNVSLNEEEDGSSIWSSFSELKEV